MINGKQEENNENFEATILPPRVSVASHNGDDLSQHQGVQEVRAAGRL